MNNIQFYIKQDGTWQKINATPVFPFSVGELLDERLDEAYITLYDSPVEHYPRLTEIRATINDGTNEKQEYFIIASDTSLELPAGSGIYKHDLYLIERTKLLEGIFCSSITFTNVGERIQSSFKKDVLTAPWQGLGEPYNSNVKRINAYYTKPFTIPSLMDISNFQKNGITYNVFTSSAPEGLGFQSIVPTGDDGEQSRIEIRDALNDNLKTVIFCQTENDLSQRFTINTKLYDLTDGLYFIKYVFALKSGSQYMEQRITYRVTFLDVAYPLKRWTITDCVTRACELAVPLFGEEKPKYRLDGVEYNDNGNVVKPYPEGSLAEKYDKIFAPEFTLTQDTLREQLRVIFSYVHAESWLDENDIIRVEEYGGTTVSGAQELPYVYSAGKSHINEYCTEVRSHAQNLASSLGYAKGTMIDPGNGLYRSLRTDVAYARINEENGIARTEKPIYSIDKVMCGIANSDGSWWLEPVDITYFVLEATEYGSNTSPYLSGNYRSRSITLYYTLGQPNIQGLFYKAPNATNASTYSPFAISNILSAVTGQLASDIDTRLVKESAADLVFSITYKPLSNYFVSHGKSLYVEGETPFIQLYNQSENVVESQYFGENLKGVAARLGNVEEERTFILKSINDIPRVGQMLDEYAISAVSTEFYPWDIKCTVGLSKDFNRISEYVGINSQKRMYEVSERQATQRDILYKETLVIGEKPTGYTNAGKLFGNLAPFNILFDSSVANNGNWRVTFARFITKKKNETANADVFLPVIGRSLGNIITFNFATKDNYSAGDSTILINGNNDVQGRWQTDVPYSNFYGRAWWADVKLNSKNDNPNAIPSLSYELPDYVNVPIAPIPRGEINNHRLRKDNRETLSYNLELEIKTTVPDLIIGSALAELSGWVNDTDVNPVLYFVDSERKISKFDKKFTPTERDIFYGDFDSSRGVNNSWRTGLNNDFSLYLSITNPTKGEYGWVICTPIETVTETVEDDDGFDMEVSYQTGGEILLASNKPLPPYSSTATTTYDFYVTKD